MPGVDAFPGRLWPWLPTGDTVPRVAAFLGRLQRGFPHRTPCRRWMRSRAGCGMASHTGHHAAGWLCAPKGRVVPGRAQGTWVLLVFPGQRRGLAPHFLPAWLGATGARRAAPARAPTAAPSCVCPPLAAGSVTSVQALRRPVGYRTGDISPPEKFPGEHSY